MSSKRGPGTVEDVDAPGLGISSPERIDLRDLSTDGLSISVELGSPAELQLALRSYSVEPPVAGARGSADRPRLTTLAKASASALAGSSEHRLILDRDAVALLAKARTAGNGIGTRIVVQARTKAGEILIANRFLAVLNQ